VSSIFFNNWAKRDVANHLASDADPKHFGSLLFANGTLKIAGLAFALIVLNEILFIATGVGMAPSVAMSVAGLLIAFYVWRLWTYLRKSAGGSLDG
jgi:hypothetical protein